MEFLQPEPLPTTDAPSWVDVSVRCKGNRMLTGIQIILCTLGLSFSQDSSIDGTGVTGGDL